ncbi:C25 family cysteine peptidase [Bacteroidota bacterium]
MKSFIILFAFFAFHTSFSQTVTLRDTTNQYDYIIITVPEFVSACEPFKQHKETIREFNTLIVETAQIFSEFDSSLTPQDNIRDFISYAGTFWKNPRPKYFLIAGSVQFVPNFNILHPVGYYSPYWQSDYYYCQNIYENDSTTTDFYVGRIPCENSAELEKYYSKVIEYESNNTLQSWMNNCLFISEDDPNFGFLEASFGIADLLPSYIRSYFISSSDTSIYYGNKDSIYNAISNRGCSIVFFEGFSSDSSFVSPEYFNLEDLAGLTNDSKYYLTIIPSTQGAIIDSNTNLTNEMLYLYTAGSLGGIAITGLSYWGIMKTFQNNWAQRIFDPSIQSIGEALDLPMLPTAGLYWQMKRITNLWADPSLKLKYDISTSVEEDNITPTDFTLHQNYPNPFNPTTKIRFSIPTVETHRDASLKTMLKVYDVLGNEIATLVKEEIPVGNYEIEFNGKGLPSGIYFYRLQAGSFVETKKMILMK